MKNNDLNSLLKRSTIKTQKIDNEDRNNTLAGKIDQFTKADQIMTAVTNNLNTMEIKQPKDKFVNVTYVIPESFSNLMNEIIKKGMRNEIQINKSEVVRLGILLASKLSFEELLNGLDSVKSNRSKKN